MTRLYTQPEIFPEVNKNHDSKTIHTQPMDKYTIVIHDSRGNLHVITDVTEENIVITAEAVLHMNGDPEAEVRVFEDLEQHLHRHVRELRVNDGHESPGWLMIGHVYRQLNV